MKTLYKKAKQTNKAKQFPKLHTTNWAVNKIVTGLTKADLKRKPWIAVPISAKSNPKKTKAVIDKMKGRKKKYPRMTAGDIDVTLLQTLQRIRAQQAKREPKVVKKLTFKKTKKTPSKSTIQKQLKYRNIVQAAKRRAVLQRK